MMAPRSLWIALAVLSVVGSAGVIVREAYAPPYQPGPRQLDVLAATKDRGYPGAVFTSPSTLVIYTRAPHHRLDVRTACGLGRNAGLEVLSVFAIDDRDRSTRLETFHCDLRR